MRSDETIVSFHFLMKTKQLITLFTILFTSTISQSQLEDPTKAVGTVPAESIPEGVETRPQHELAALWIDKLYWSWYPETANGMMKMGTSQEVKFKKNDAGMVTEIWVGTAGVEDKYPLIFPTGSDFTYCYHINNMMNLYITENALVCYYINSDGNVTGLDWVARSRKSYGPMKKEIQAYLDYASLKIEADRQARIAARAEHRKKYSLEGKDVVGIELVFPDGKPSTMSLSGVEIGLEATLADGSKIKTKNLGGEGYIEDYNFEFYNGQLSGVRDNYLPLGYGDYYAPSSTIHGAYTDITGKDIFRMKVTSDYGGSGSVEITIPLAYPSSYNFASSGEYGVTYPGNGRANGGAAGHGSPLKIWVKTVQHTETNEAIYLVKIQDGFTQAVTYLKLSKGGSLNVTVNGGGGGDGSPGRTNNEDDAGKPESGGNGGQGGNGGDIHLILDPSAKDFLIVYENKAGKGGSAGRGGDCNRCPFGSDGDRGVNGNDGKSGTFKQEIKAVTL